MKNNTVTLFAAIATLAAGFASAGIQSPKTTPFYPENYQPHGEIAGLQEVVYPGAQLSAKADDRVKFILPEQQGQTYPAENNGAAYSQIGRVNH